LILIWVSKLRRRLVEKPSLSFPKIFNL